MNDLLTKSIIDLFAKERLYAELILQMDRVTTRSIPTMGVAIKDRVTLYVNPEFFLSLTEDERIALLKHECGHILHDHIPRFKKLAPDIYDKTEDVPDQIINSIKHKSMNIAADLALNCNIQNLPKMGCFPKAFGLKDGETFEWYLENLKDNEKMKKMTKFDNHSVWSESEGSQEIVREKIRQMVNTAASNTKAAGQLTSSQELLISKMNKKSQNWKAILRQFASRQISVVLDSSRKKRNRRYGIRIPGYVKTEELHIGVAIDTSGSVSDEALNQFLAEISNIAKYATVTVVEADSEVKNSYLFDPKKEYRFSGRGGTAYKPAFDYFTNETEVDGVIYFGDMDCFDNEVLVKPRYPVLWAIVGHQAPPASWGTSVRVEILRK